MRCTLCLLYLSLFSDSVFIVLHTAVSAYQVSVSVWCLALSLFSVSISLHTTSLCLPAVCVSLFSVSIEVLSLLLPGLCVCLLSLSVSIRCLYFYRILHIVFVQPPPPPPPPLPTAPPLLVWQGLKNKAQGRQVKHQVKRPVKPIIPVTKPGMAGAEEEVRGALRGNGACSNCMS